MREIRTYICAVDAYRNGFVFRAANNRLYERNTEGTYAVGAKTPKEAKAILQKAIRFGSVEVQRTKTKSDVWNPSGDDQIPDCRYKEIYFRTNVKIKDGRRVDTWVKKIPKATDALKDHPKYSVED